MQRGSRGDGKEMNSSIKENFLVGNSSLFCDLLNSSKFLRISKFNRKTYSSIKNKTTDFYL